ncbi:MAG: hypothetical protein ACYCZK_04795, partial [Microbacteriaceae bacterium]
VFVAYGRTADVQAWIGDAGYTTIGYDKNKKALTSKTVPGKTQTVPNPANSDLWLQQYSQPNSVSFVANVPQDVSLIIASDGTKPAPDRISIGWPRDNRMPWAGPLITIGAVLLVLGLFLYLWALIHLRRTRGPRRKPPKMPKIPRQRAYKTRRAVVPSRGRRVASRRMAVLPVVLIGALGLSGCSVSAGSTVSNLLLGPSPSHPASSAVPSPSLATPASGDLQPPGVTAAQARMIISRVADVAAKADAGKDATLLATRFEGPALQLRTANYAIRKLDASYPGLQAIPGSKAELILPQQTSTWPRTLVAVMQSTQDAKLPPLALMLVQHSPRDNYKVQYAITLEAKALLPDVAAAAVGAARLPPDTKLLNHSPANLAMDYGNTLLLGNASKFIGDFVTSGDTLRAQVGSAAKAAKRAALPPTASIDFSNAPGSGDSIAMATSKSGAIVAVSLNEIETVKPVAAGASVNPEGAVKILSGLTSTVKGVVATYGDQLLFYVPPSTSTEKITLLGYSQGLISATELP